MSFDTLKGRPIDNRLPSIDRAEYGDRAGEHRQMRRGRFSAWVHVILAFLGQIAVVYALLVSVLTTAGKSLQSGTLGFLMLLTLAVAIGTAVWTFWDRWRVNEAFSSRFCSGLANISILYVPIISYVYANYRAVQRLRGQ
jgi:hypothetical protein